MRRAMAVVGASSYKEMKPAAWLLVSLVLLAGCSDTGMSGGRERPPAPADLPVVATAVKRTVPVHLRVIGATEAVVTIAVRPQVSGELMSIGFREGQDVGKGDLLFTLDRRPFEAALGQAQAALAKDQAQPHQLEAIVARDEAQARNAAADAARYAELYRRELIAREQYDQFRTAAEVATATVRADRAAVTSAAEAVRADEAAVEAARLQREYCTIRAPIDGRAGSLLVQPGNVVKANDTALVTINQVSPIYVGFAVPEQRLGEIRRPPHADGAALLSHAHSPVRAEGEPRGGEDEADEEQPPLDPVEAGGQGCRRAKPHGVTGGEHDLGAMPAVGLLQPVPPPGREDQARHPPADDPGAPAASHPVDEGIGGDHRDQAQGQGQPPANDPLMGEGGARHDGDLLRERQTEPSEQQREEHAGVRELLDELVRHLTCPRMSAGGASVRRRQKASRRLLRMSPSVTGGAYASAKISAGTCPRKGSRILSSSPLGRPRGVRGGSEKSLRLRTSAPQGRWRSLHSKAKA